MKQRLNYYKASPAAIKAMLGLEERIGKSSIEKSLAELVRLRASQINGCAFCVDMHTTDARKGGENRPASCDCRDVARNAVLHGSRTRRARMDGSVDAHLARSRARRRVGSGPPSLQRRRTGRPHAARFHDQRMEPLRDFVPLDA